MESSTEKEIETALGPFPTITSASLLRTRFSDSALNPPSIESENRRLRDKGILFPQRSELVLTTAQKQKRQQNLDQPVTDEEYVLASHLLENLVSESQNKKLRVVTLPGGRKVVNLFENESSEYKDRVYELVYGTMKYLSVIDTILVKTQFLVYNSQFLNNLCLIKVMLFELMKRHFDYSKKSGIQYISKSGDNAVDLVQEIAEAFHGHQTKLAAAFARIRIEKHASGKSYKEQLENILPEEVRRKESVAVDMPKHMRINTLKRSQEQTITMLMDRGYRVWQGSDSPPNKWQGDDIHFIKVDREFNTLLEMPATLFHEIKNTPLVSNGYLIPQDKASFLGAQIFSKKLEHDPEPEIIDVRAGSGTKTCHLAALASNKGRIFAFENRRAQIDTLAEKMKVCGVKNAEIVEADFLNTDAKDERFSGVSTVFIEAPSSGTAIVDKLEYLLQEKEFPFEEYTERDLGMLRKNQINVLKHAFEFPKVQTVVYITRSENIEENEEIVSEALDENTFDLESILPEYKTDRSPNVEYSECFKMDASDYGNGTFVACFERIPVPEPGLVDDEEKDLSTRVNSMEIIEAGQSLHKKKKSGLGSKSNRRRTKSMTAIQNTRNDSRSSLTLAPMPPVFQRLTSRIKLDQTQSQTKGRKYEKEVDGSTDEEEGGDDDEDPAAHHERRQRRRERKGSSEKAKYTMSLGVFGLSLKHFYAPKHHAILESSKSIPDLTSTKSKSWVYPVPNPRPWF